MPKGDSSQKINDLLDEDDKDEVDSFDGDLKRNIGEKNKKRDSPSPSPSREVEKAKDEHLSDFSDFSSRQGSDQQSQEGGGPDD
jgi:hypothetical protein